MRFTKILFACTTLAFLGGCSWNGVTGFEGAQGYAGLLHLEIDYQEAVGPGPNDSDEEYLPPIRKVTLWNGKDTSEEESYFELPDGTIVIISCAECSGIDAIRVRGETQQGITGNVTDAAGNVIGTMLNGIFTAVPEPPTPLTNGGD